jgi:hypothetical protein
VTPRCRKAKNSRHPSPMESFLGNTYSASELKLTFASWAKLLRHA